MKSINSIGTIAFASLAMTSATAFASDTSAKYINRSAVLQAIGNGSDRTLGRAAIEDAVDPDTNRRAGPGYEQATVAHLVGLDKLHYVVVIVMQNPPQPLKEGQGPYQLSCSSFQLSETGAPTAVVTNKFITNNPGNRSANHPVARQATLADGQDVIAFTYGSQMGTNRTKTYFSVVDEQCNKLLPDVKVSEVEGEQDNDRGAPDLAYHGIVNGAARMSFGYFSNGDDDATYFGALDLKEQNGILAAVPVYTPKMVLGPSNIGRASIAPNGTDRAIMCAAAGRNSRPEANVQCAHMNVSTGEILWKNNVATGVMSEDPYKRKYFGQPTIASLGDGNFAISALESNGAAKNGNQRNLKGSNLAHLYYVSVNPGTESLDVKGEIVGAAVHQTHSAICSSKFGVDGKPTVGVVSAAPTGIGRAALLTVHFDSTQASPFAFDQKQDAWPINYNGDSGFLANMYGDNPGRQGRDFMRCTGDIPNPGYHVENGYLADVKSFWAAAIPGREVGNAKNSLYLSLLPAETDTPGTPTNPIAAQDVPTETAIPTSAPKPKEGGGCGCDVVGTTTSSRGLFAVLALAGLAFVRIASRRRSH